MQDGTSGASRWRSHPTDLLARPRHPTATQSSHRSEQSLHHPSARKRRSTADLAVADADFAVALDWLLRLHREQGKSEKFIAKEQRGFVAKYNSGAETSDDDDAEGDE